MKELEKWREILQEKAREALKVMGWLNEMEKTVSRLKNEVQDLYEKIDEALDK